MHGASAKKEQPPINEALVIGHPSDIVVGADPTRSIACIVAAGKELHTSVAGVFLDGTGLNALTEN